MYLLTGTANGRYIKSRSFSSFKKARKEMILLSKKFRSKTVDLILEDKNKNIVSQLSKYPMVFEK